MQTFSLIGGWAAFLIALGLTVYLVRSFLDPTGTKSFKWETAALVVTVLYPLGFWLKLTVLGPAFLRWHLGDVGFPAFIGMWMLSYHAQHFGFKEHAYTQFNAARQDYRWLDMKRRCVVIAVGLSYAYELFIGWVFRTFPEARDAGHVGDFDWIDVAAYTIGGAVAYLCLTRALQHLKPGIELEMAREQAYLDEQRRLQSQQKSSAASKRRRAEGGRRKRR